MNYQLLQAVMIPLEKIENNTGQVDGLPANPRKCTEKDLQTLKKSLKETPEMLGARELLVVPHGDKYVVVGGNMRLRALRAIGETQAPCKILPEGTDLKAILIKDNVSNGAWDDVMLQADWDAEQLADWGLEIQLPQDGTDSEGQAAGMSDKPSNYEELCDDAIVEYSGELVSYYGAMLQRQWQFIGLAKLRFLQAKYEGKKYPRFLSYTFTPEQLNAYGDSKPLLQQLQEIASRKTRAGVAGLKTILEHATQFSVTSQYPIGSTKQCLDFPAELAKNFIHQYAHGGDILDPCHGWGGRLVGAMLDDARSYTGIDPSPFAHRGVSLIAESFKDYAPTEVRLLEMPFEDAELPDEAYDLALTSPPYFDVEKYEGEQTSTTRYPKYDLWREKFYKQLIYKTMKALRPNGTFILQVGSQKYPLGNDAIAIAKELGYKAEIIQSIFLGTTQLHNTDEEKSEQVVKITKSTQSTI